MDCNNNPRGNPVGLVAAYRFYDNAVYQRLVDKLGIANVYLWLPKTTSDLKTQRFRSFVRSWRLPR